MRRENELTRQSSFAVLTNKGRDTIYLLNMQEGSKHAGSYHLPGGKAEEGEEPIDALRRELSEELEALPIKEHERREAWDAEQDDDSDYRPTIFCKRQGYMVSEYTCANCELNCQQDEREDYSLSFPRDAYIVKRLVKRPAFFPEIPAVYTQNIYHMILRDNLVLVSNEYKFKVEAFDTAVLKVSLLYGTPMRLTKAAVVGLSAFLNVTPRLQYSLDTQDPGEVAYGTEAPKPKGKERNITGPEIRLRSHSGDTSQDVRGRRDK